MTTARGRMVEELHEAVESGNSHPLLEAFERAFLPPPRHDFALQFGPRSRFEGVYIPTQLWDVFQKVAVVGLSVLGPGMETEVLPGITTHGLCAWTPKGLVPLHHRPEALSELLRVEGRPLEDFPLPALLYLVLETLCRRGNASALVVESAEEVLAYQANGYELDEAAWRRARGRLVPATLRGNAAEGWVLEFCSLFGWMHELEALVRHRVEVSPDFAIRCSKRALARKLFTRFPGIVY